MNQAVPLLNFMEGCTRACRPEFAAFLFLFSPGVEIVGAL
jgi:hypothetical protein